MGDKDVDMKQIIPRYNEGVSFDIGGCRAVVCAQGNSELPRDDDDCGWDVRTEPMYLPYAARLAKQLVRAGLRVVVFIGDDTVYDSTDKGDRPVAPWSQIYFH